MSTSPRRRTPRRTASFAEALQSAGGSVVLPSFQQPRTDRMTLQVNRPLQQFSEHSWPAVVNVEVGPDGLVRRYPFGEKLDDKFVPSMAAVLSGQYAEKRAPFLIDFSIRTAWIPKVSFVDVLRGDRSDAAKTAARKSSSAAPRSNLAIGSAYRTAHPVRPRLQTLAAESLLQNRALQWTSRLVTLAGLGLLASSCCSHGVASPPASAWRCSLAMAVGIEAAAFLLQAMLPAHSRHLAVSHRHHRLHRGHRARRNRHQGSAGPGRRKPLSARGDVARRRPDLHRFQLPDHGVESRRDGDLRLSAGGDDRPAVRRDLRPRRRSCAAPSFSIRERR